LSYDKYWSGKAWQTGEAWLTVTGKESWYYTTASSIWTTDTYYVLTSKAMDMVGNEEPDGASSKFMYDNKAPTNLSMTIKKGSDPNSTEYDLELDAKDSGSGVWKMSFRTNTTSWTDWEDFSSKRTFNVSTKDTHINYKVKDKCNNIADSISVKIPTGNATKYDPGTDNETSKENKTQFGPETETDTDGDGVPDSRDAFPKDKAASLDTDGDGRPDQWNPGMDEDDSTTGLYLDAFPDDPAASIDSDGDGYPDEWNPGMSAEDSTTGLKLDDYPLDPKRQVIEEFKEDSPAGTSVMILSIVVFIVVLVLICISYTMKKKQRPYSPMAGTRIINDIKEDIIYGKSSMEKEYTGSELREVYFKNYDTEELSPDSIEYINNLIEESD
jgi:hypothetical protein